MGQQYSEKGGGAATGLADNLIQFLSQGLNTGSFGAGTAAGGDSIANTQGVAGVLNDILAGGAGNAGGALANLIRQDTNDQVLNMRARYGAQGGTAFGTGAQYGEGVLRARQAPAITKAVGDLQLNAVTNLLGLMGNIAQKGIAQRQGVMQENPWMTGLKVAGNVGGQALAAMATGGASIPLTAAMTAGNLMANAPTIAGGGQGLFSGADLGIGSNLSPSSGLFSNTRNLSQAPTLFDYGIQ